MGMLEVISASGHCSWPRAEEPHSAVDVRRQGLPREQYVDVDWLCLLPGDASFPILNLESEEVNVSGPVYGLKWSKRNLCCFLHLADFLWHGDTESRNETPEYILVLSKCTLPCSVEIVSVVILVEVDFIIAANNGTIFHYITVHVPGDFQTSKAYLGGKKRSPS